MLMIDHEENEQSYYGLLGLKRDAKPKDIKKAFRRLSKIHHPDIGGDIKIFQMLNDAYETLIDPEKRFLYDRMSYSKQELAKMVNMCVGHVINVFAKGLTTQKQVRDAVKAILEAEISELNKHKINIEGGTQLVERVLDSIERTDGSFITKMVVENIEAKIRGNKSGLAQLEKDLKMLKSGVEFMDKINLKKKDIEIYQWTSSNANTTSNAPAGLTIKIFTGT